MPDLDEFIDWLQQWAESYPEDVFPPVDMRDVDEREHYSHHEVVSIASRNAAGMARHLLSRVVKKAREIDPLMERHDG